MIDRLQFTTGDIISENAEQGSTYLSKSVSELSDEWIAIRSAQVKESTLANYKMKLEKHIFCFLASCTPSR